jgi:cytochrome c biogenesis protein ResB
VNSVALRNAARKKTMQQILAAEAKRLNSEHNIDKKSIISTQQVEEFLERGVVVIRNVLNSDEILKARKGKFNRIVLRI